MSQRIFTSIPFILFLGLLNGTALLIPDAHVYLRALCVAVLTGIICTVMRALTRAQIARGMNLHLQDASAALSDLLDHQDTDPEHDEDDTAPRFVPFSTIAIGDEYVENGILFRKTSATTVRCDALDMTLELAPATSLVPTVIYRHSPCPPPSSTSPASSPA